MNINLISSVLSRGKKESVAAFFKRRFWLVLILAVISVSAVSLVIFSDEVMAKIYHANGFYTKVCGDYISPNGDIDGNVFRPSDACQNKCDLGAGTCSGNTVYRFECDGKTTDCRSNVQGPSSSQSLNRSGLCGKTVQIDVFRRNCLASGDCNNLPAYDSNADLQDFIVWYAGDCSVPPPTSVVCNNNAVSLYVSPNPVNANQSINFTIFGDASTFVDDSFGGGANNCTGNWAVNGSGLTCTAGSQSGNFTWTHSWKHCEGGNSNCSNTCTKTANFSVASVIHSPSVDFKVNNSDGPITISYNSAATLSWTSNNANSCTASNAWSGTKYTSGSESTGNLTYSRTYTITCAGNGGTATDSVTVNVEVAPAPTVDLKANSSDGPISVSYRSNVNLSWTSLNAASCNASGDWSGTKYTSGSQSIQMNLIGSRTFTLACTDSTGTNTRTDQVTINVTPNLPIVITKPAIVTY